MYITCKCGHMSLREDFEKTTIGGDLPNNHYQCPKCNKAWSIQTSGKATVNDNGMIIPPGLKIKTESPRL